VGAAGTAGVGAALAATSRAAAATDPVPSAPTARDTALLRGAMALELTAAELYALAAATLNDETASAVAADFGSNHEAYAEEIAGIAGLSADRPIEVVFRERESSFDTTDVTEFATAGAELESAAAATYGELLGRFESSSARTLVASILVVEARMSTVLTDLAGDGDDLDAMLNPAAEPLSLDEVAG
jgi:hypothetical protein